MKKHFYGGQAVIEGVMIRGITNCVVAVRNKKKEIVIGIIGKTRGVKRAKNPIVIARMRNELILLWSNRIDNNRFINMGN